MRNKSKNIMTLLCCIIFFNSFSQTKTDTLKSIGCGTIPEPNTLRIKYSGCVVYDNKPVTDLNVIFYKPTDTVTVTTNDSGLFTTTLFIDNKKRQRIYPKILIQDKAYDKFEFQITEFHIDTIPINSRHYIILTKGRK